LLKLRFLSYTYVETLVQIFLGYSCFKIFIIFYNSSQRDKCIEETFIEFILILFIVSFKSNFKIIRSKSCIIFTQQKVSKNIIFYWILNQKFVIFAVNASGFRVYVAVLASLSHFIEM